MIMLPLYYKNVDLKQQYQTGLCCVRVFASPNDFPYIVLLFLLLLANSAVKTDSNCVSKQTHRWQDGNIRFFSFCNCEGSMITCLID